MTELEIVNNALLMIGDATISASEFASPTEHRAKVVSQMWASSRDFILRSHPWNCLMTNARLGAPQMSPSDRSGVLTVRGIQVIHDQTSTAGAVRGTDWKASGSWAFAVRLETASTAAVGVGTSSASLSGYVGQDAYGWAYLSNGNKVNSGSASAYGASFTAGDVISVALDATNGTLAFYKNGVSQGIAFSSGLSGNRLYPMLSLSSAGGMITVAFDDSLVASPPSGYDWWTANKLIAGGKWTYAMELPSDCMRLVSSATQQGGIDYELQGRSILTNERFADISYVRSDSPERWDASLTQAAISYLAMKIAYPITKSNAVQESMRLMFEAHMRSARLVDGQENPPQTFGDAPFIAARAH